MTLAEALDVAGWPQSLAEDASKAPTVLEDAAAFVDCLLWGKHVDDIVVLRGGVWSATRFANREPAGCLEGAFLHLQRWKGEYKRLTYGGAGMPPLRGRPAGVRTRAAKRLRPTARASQPSAGI